MPEAGANEREIQRKLGESLAWARTADSGIKKKVFSKTGAEDRDYRYERSKDSWVTQAYDSRGRV